MRAERPVGRPRLGLLYPLLLFALAATATALIIDNKTRVVGGSYEIESLRGRLEELRMRNRQLRLERSAIDTQPKLEDYILKEGLQPPRPEQILLLPPAPGAKP